MTKYHYHFLYCLLSLLILSTNALAELPAIAGSWRFTFYLEPNRDVGTVQCLTFKSVPGTVKGIHLSGIFTSSTFPEWHGEWIQIGDHLRFVGVTSSLFTAAAGRFISKEKIGGGAFNHINKYTARHSTAGNWEAVKETVCTSSSHTTPDPLSDPAQLS